ncbi:MAG TPA: hypothetical protein VGN72_24250 [Tepidisphaeraceae bacterium]|nr:hypothetical protein [Tepidisphaeraceae bacterium]
MSDRHAADTAVPFDVRPIWGDGPTDAPALRLFRRRIGSGAARLRLFAEGRYHAWLDGAYLGRGPTPHHPDERLYDSFDLTPRIAATGGNVLAVLVCDPTVPTLAAVPTGHPGLWAQFLDADGRPLDDGGAWRVSPDAGLATDVPRRTLVIGHVEHLDLRRHPVGWQATDFDDAVWPIAPTFEAPPFVAHVGPNPHPPLRHTDVSFERLIGRFAIANSPEPLAPGAQTLDRAGLDGTAAYGRSLMDAGWTQMDRDSSVAIEANGSCVCVSGLTPPGGVALVFDLGAEYVGEPMVALESDGPGVIDVGFAESLDDAGRPQLLMKHGSYANRITTPGGRVDYAAIDYSGFRYIAVMLRGFTGAVDVTHAGVRATEADLAWQELVAGDAELDALVALSIRTVRLGCQDALIDCPTREQATYIGDGHAVARWVYTLTGDARYWRQLTRAQFARPAANGLIRTVVWSAGPQMLLDYELLAIVGTRDYFRHTGDLDTVRDTLRAARGVYAWFERQFDSRGLCPIDATSLPKSAAREELYDPAMPDGQAMQALFIDHAGMGWHNLEEPGIDRRGTNAALQALLSITERALADLEEAAGDRARAAKLRQTADNRRTVARRCFFDEQNGVFADGVVGGERLPQVSEQTNVWAVLAGWCETCEARDLLARLIGGDDRHVARCGPYFWMYAVRALRDAGLDDLLLAQTLKRYRPMLDAGATSLWESFAGDALDSRCHPWSAAPIDVALGSFAARETPEPLKDVLARHHHWRGL